MTDRQPGSDQPIPSQPSSTGLRRFLPRCRQTGLGFPLALFLIARGVLTGLALALWWSGLVPTAADPILRPYFGFPPLTAGLAGATLGVWQRFDAIHYLRIASQGYLEAPLSAFSPLYPLLVRPLGQALGGSWTLAAFLVSNAACLGAMMALFILVREELGSQDLAQRTLVYQIFFPTGFFLMALYPESLLLLATASALLLARRGQWGWAVIPAVAAGLARPQGAVLVFPLAYMAWRAWKDKRVRYALPVSAAPAAGVGAFLLWRQSAGFPSIGEVAATYWKRVPAFPFAGLLQAAQRISAGRARLLEPLELALLILVLAIGIYLALRLPLPYRLYFWAGLILNTMTITVTDPLASQVRYAVTLFPMFMALAILGQRKWVHRLILYTSLALNLFLAGEFIMWGWVG